MRPLDSIYKDQQTPYVYTKDQTEESKITSRLTDYKHVHSVVIKSHSHASLEGHLQETKDQRHEEGLNRLLNVPSTFIEDNLSNSIHSEKPEKR